MEQKPLGALPPPPLVTEGLMEDATLALLFVSYQFKISLEK